MHYYPLTFKLDRSVGSCNTLNDLSNKVCVPNKTEDLNIQVFKMITGKNESRKDISCKCKYKLMEENVIQIKSEIMINVDVSVKNIYVKKITFRILLHVVVKMVNI